MAVQVSGKKTLLCGNLRPAILRQKLLSTPPFGASKACLPARLLLPSILSQTLVFIYIYIYIYTHICVYIYIHTCIASLSLSIYIYIHIHIYPCIHIYIYIYFCCLFMCIYIYIYVCIGVHMEAWCDTAVARANAPQTWTSQYNCSFRTFLNANLNFALKPWNLH